MDARWSWADLPADLFAVIARRVPCLADRVRAARACRTWLEGVLKNPCPPMIPRLLLPADALPPDATHTASFFCVLCNRPHRVAALNDTGGARFFGAYPGGWLFLAYGQSGRHGLINLRTRERLYLPDSADTLDESESNRNHPMLIRAATLSAPPAPIEGCVAAAAIVTNLTPECFLDLVHITLWRMGSRLGSTMFQFDAEDVIYHNGAFHFLSQHWDLLICRPEFQDEAPLERLQVRRDYHPMVGVGYVLNAGASYLVECRGELLMVMRVQPHQDVTSQFKVYRMTRDADQALYGWTELPALDGRMLFIGRGCSKSFEAAHFPGSQEGVYFLDDGNFYAAPIICVGDKPPQYGHGCCKNGVWSGPPDHIRYWFPEQRLSTYSSPVWFLH